LAAPANPGYIAVMIERDSTLIADIGGTNSRFALARHGVLRGRLSVANDSVSGIEAAIEAYLAGHAEPARAVFAVAAPVTGRVVRLTNRDWIIDADAIAARFGFAEVTLLNDFAAVAHGLPALQPEDLKMIGAALPVPDRTKVVLGPGTGLGVAALIRHGGGWIALPSEGGHVELGATTALEAAVFERVRARQGRVSAEFVSSGTGLVMADRALSEVEGRPAVARDGAAIVAAARAGDVHAGQVLGLFLDALARFAGDMAVTFVAQGGVYLAGGILPKIVDLVDPVRFRALFEAKAPHVNLMAGIATAVVLEEDPGLVGCGAFAARWAL
jgi:glucokinase